MPIVTHSAETHNLDSQKRIKFIWVFVIIVRIYAHTLLLFLKLKLILIVNGEYFRYGVISYCPSERKPALTADS